MSKIDDDELVSALRAEAENEGLSDKLQDLLDDAADAIERLREDAEEANEAASEAENELAAYEVDNPELASLTRRAILEGRRQDALDYFDKLVGENAGMPASTFDSLFGAK